MNVGTVILNIENTIVGKILLLEKFQQDLISATDETEIVGILGAIEFLKININELERIKFDLNSIPP